MDDQVLKYFKLCNQRYRLDNAINYLSHSNKKDGFEYEVLDYAKDEIAKVNMRINGMKRKLGIR
jgi:hypothetical protein